MCLRLCYQMVEEILYHLLSMKLHLKDVIFSIHQLVLNSMKRVAPWFQDLNICKGISALMKHDPFRTSNILSLGPSWSETNWPARKQRKHLPPKGKPEIIDQTGGDMWQFPGRVTAAAAEILYLLLSVPAQLVGFLLDGKQKPKLIWEGTTNFFQVRAQHKNIQKQQPHEIIPPPTKNKSTIQWWCGFSCHKKWYMFRLFSPTSVFLFLDLWSFGFYAAQSISRDWFWERFLFYHENHLVKRGKPTLKVALNIQNSQDFKTHVSSRVRGYMIYIYIHLVYIIFLCCHC